VGPLIGEEIQMMWWPYHVDLDDDDDEVEQPEVLGDIYNVHLFLG
jgi:hypothetical protein